MQAKGGDLRIMYPEPEVCLNLKSWQEFYSFDMNSYEGWFEFDIDTDKYTLEVKKTDITPPGFGPVPEGKYIYSVDEMKKVKADERINLDITGEERNGDTVLPGPINELKFNEVYSIDPRK